jgi:hypothetical protein
MIKSAICPENGCNEKEADHFQMKQPLKLIYFKD